MILGPEMGIANLPAGLNGKTCNLHAERSSSRTRSGAFLELRLVIATSSAGKLDDEALAHEGGTICEGQYGGALVPMEEVTYGRLVRILAESQVR